MSGTDIGYYTLPVLLSFDGVDKQVNSKLSKSFGDFGKKASKDLSAGLKSSEADVKRLTDAYSKLRDKGEDSLGKVRVAEAALTKARSSGDTARIVAAEERLGTARRNSVRDIRAATDAHGLLQSAQKRLGDGNDDLGRKFGSMSDLAGTAGKAITAAGVVAAGAAVAGVAALAVGVAAAGSALYDLGAQFDDTFDNIRIKTGATGPALQQLEDATKRLSTNVPLSIGEVGNVVAETSRALHLTGSDLDDTAKSIANLGRLTGENVDIHKLGQVFRGFGIEAKDQVPTLDALFRASQQTGIGVNDLLASVGKGTAQLKAFHIGLGPATALMSLFNEAGLDGDKAMTGLTKSLAYLAGKGVNDPQKGLSDIVTQIKALSDAGDEAGGRNLANKVFGAKGGKDFFDQIASGQLDLANLGSEIANTGDTIQGAANDTDDWAERWQTLKNTVSIALEPLGTTVFDSINEQLGNLATWVEGHQNEIIDFFVMIGQGAITGVDVALDAIGQLAQGVGQFIEPFGDIQGAMLDFQAWQAEIRGDDETARELRDQAQAAYGWGEGLDAAGAAMRNFDPSALRNKLGEVGDAAKNSGGKVEALSGAIGQLAGRNINVPINVDTSPANVKMQQFFDTWNNAVINPKVLPPGGSPIPPGGPQNPLLAPYPRAAGGIYDVWKSVASFANGKLPNQAMIQQPVAGAGLVQWAEPSTGGEAFIPLNGGERSKKIWAETGRRLMKFDQGGIRGIDALYAEAQSLTGTKYSMSAGDDCSGTMSQLVNAALGLAPKADRMSTATAAQWLAKKGAYPGIGPPGTFSMGWKNGGPGGGHMAGTLPDGTHVEMGGANGGYTLGGNAKGANDPTFTDHAYLPIEALYPDGYASGSGVSPYGSASGGGGMAGVGPNGEAGTYSAPDQAAVAEKSGQVREADAKVAEAEAKLRELKADAKDSEKISAQNDVEKAKNDAAKARADLAEAKKGKFTPGGGKSGGKGGGDLSEIGSIFGSFLKETTGFDGSLFPDIGNLMPVQMANTLLGALVPQGGSDASAMASTSSSPFGIPDIAVPPAPQGTPASGFGAGPLPGPAGPTTVIDQSIHGGVNGSIDQVMKQRDEGLKRAVQRIPVGS